MGKRSSVALVTLVASGLAFFALRPHCARAQEPDPCDAVIGTWAWFTGGPVTIRADHTMAFQSKANDGTWQCLDASRRLLLLNWRVGGFVNRVILSPDGRRLTSADPSQAYVHATRVGAAAAVRPETQGGASGATSGGTAEGVGRTEVPAEGSLSSRLRGAADRMPGSAGSGASGWDRDAVYRAREAGLKQAIAAHPNDPDALVALASFYLRPLAPRVVQAADGKVHRVMVPLRNQIRPTMKYAVDISPLNFWMFRGDPQAAYPLLQKALALDPHDARAIREMAMLYRQEQDLVHMRPYMEAALENDPTDLDMVRLYMDYQRGLALQLQSEAGALEGGHHSETEGPCVGGGQCRILHDSPPTPAELARAHQLEAQAKQARQDAYNRLESFARALSNDPQVNSDPRKAAEWAMASALRAAWLGDWNDAVGTAIKALRYDPTYLDALDLATTVLRYAVPSGNAQNLQDFKAAHDRYIALLDLWNGGDSTPIEVPFTKRGTRH